MNGETNTIAPTNSGNDNFLLSIEGKLAEYTVPEGVTEIVPYSFFHTGEKSKGTTITLANSIETIGDWAFGCQTNGIGKNTVNNKILNVPENLKTIGKMAFYKCSFPNGCLLPEGLVSIGINAFSMCTFPPDTFIIPSTVTTFGESAFDTNQSLKSVIIRNGVNFLPRLAFSSCSNLKEIYIPNSITSVSSSPFNKCSSLEYITLESGFNADGLYLANTGSTKFSAETIVSWFEALADRTGQPTYTLTIGADNLAKLTEEQIAIATAKNWTLA